MTTRGCSSRTVRFILCTHPSANRQHRFRRAGEGQAVQQNRRQGQDVNFRDNPAFVHPARTLLCLSHSRYVLRMFRFHHHRLDCFNALVHVFYTKICRICNVRTFVPPKASTTLSLNGCEEEGTQSSWSSLMRSSSLKRNSCISFVKTHAVWGRGCKVGLTDRSISFTKSIIEACSAL